MKTNRYSIAVDKYNDATAYLDHDLLNGLMFTPKNGIKYDGITVNKAMIIKPSFIEKVLKKKNKRKLELYLQYVITLLDNDDADGEAIGSALSDLDRYRSIIKNNYRKYLDDKYIELLLKKIALIEHELKLKALNLMPVKEEKARKSR